MGRVRPFPEQAAAVGNGCPNRFEHVGGKLLGNQANHGTRRPIVHDDIVTAYGDRAGARGDNTANYTNESRLAGAIGSEQREYFALIDVEIDALQRLKTRLVGLRQAFDGDNVRHFWSVRCVYVGAALDILRGNVSGRLIPTRLPSKSARRHSVESRLHEVLGG
jgi:hypothetical protein